MFCLNSSILSVLSTRAVVTAAHVQYGVVAQTGIDQHLSVQGRVRLRMHRYFISRVPLHKGARAPLHCRSAFDTRDTGLLLLKFPLHHCIVLQVGKVPTEPQEGRNVHFICGLHSCKHTV